MTETADRAADPSLRSDLEDIYGRYEEMRSGVDELQRSLATLQVSAKSEDGAVEATVDADGRLVDLRLDQLACREWNVETLARTIVETVQQASAGKHRQIEHLVTNHRSAEDAS